MSEYRYMNPHERRPAVLLLDDGSRVELPDISVGEALELVRIAREDNMLIGSETDPRRVREVGFEEGEGEGER
jgi:hypothetical protein